MEPDSRNLYRNHERKCSHRREGRKYNKCRCPVWIDFSYAGRRVWKSLRTRDWKVAEKLVRQWLETNDVAPRVEEGVSPTADAQQAASQSLEAACAEFLADAAARGLREATLYKFRLLLRRLLMFAQERGLTLVTNLKLDAVREFRAVLPHKNTAAREEA